MSAPRGLAFGGAVRHLAEFCAVLWVACTLLLGAWAIVPTALTPLTGTVVLSGSMAPAVRAGDVVLAEPLTAGRAEVGMVLLFEQHGRLGPVLHRVRRITNDGQLITQGDANPTEDTPPVRPAQVRGVGRILVPYAGLPRLWLHSGQRHLCLVWTATILVAALYAGRRVGAVLGLEAPPAPAAVPTRKRRAATTGLTTLVVLALVAGGPTAAGSFTARTTATLASSAAVLQPPENVQVVCNPLLGVGTGLRISWTATTDGVSDRYALQRTIGATVTQLGPVTDTTYTDTPLAPGTTATYRVRSRLAAAAWSSAWSPAVTATVPLTCS